MTEGGDAGPRLEVKESAVAQHLNGMCDQCTSYGGVHNKYGGKNRWLLSRLANFTCFAALAIEDLGSIPHSKAHAELEALHTVSYNDRRSGHLTCMADTPPFSRQYRSGHPCKSLNIEHAHTPASILISATSNYSPKC